MGEEGKKVAEVRKVTYHGYESKEQKQKFKIIQRKVKVVQEEGGPRRKGKYISVMNETP